MRKVIILSGPGLLRLWSQPWHYALRNRLESPTRSKSDQMAKNTDNRDYKLEQINHPIRLGRAWSYAHQDYQGNEDNRYGFCDSIKECVEAINELDDVDMNDQDVADAADRIEFAMKLEEEHGKGD